MSMDLSLTTDPFRPDTGWFNRLFEQVGIDAEVRSFDAVSIGTGQIGTNIRFTFDYARHRGEAPASLVGKFPTENEQSRATAKMLRHYQREVKFYQTFPDLAAEIAPPCLYSAYEPDTDNFAVIMGDMAPGQQGDQLKGCSVAEAERAMEYAAALHAHRWRDPEIETFPWLQESEAEAPSEVPENFTEMLWAGFKDRYRRHLAPEEMEVGDAFVAHLGPWRDTYAGPRCLTHGDYRLDNMLFSAADARQPLAVVDWQTLGVRAPALDVAYFIGAGLTREDRPKHEKALVEHYHRALCDRGVDDYPFEALWEDYRRYPFYGMSVAFGAAMIVEQTERGDRMFLTMIRRHTDQVLALDSVALLESL